MTYLLLKKQALRFLPVKILYAFVLFTSGPSAFAQQSKSSMTYRVAMPRPASQIYQVIFTYTRFKADMLELKMPAWTPGYYQLLHYAKQVSNFNATDGNGKTIAWTRPNANSWQLQTKNTTTITVSYDVKATTAFVAQPFLDSTHGYIVPAGVFLYVAGMINHPVTVSIEPYKKWASIATGLEPVAGKKFTYHAADFDILYDSPLLTGNLETLPSFTVRGIPHYFTGYKMGAFNRAELMNDLQKIVEAGTDIFGDIPYPHYTFIAIGPGRGGLEHFNSTTISFDGSQLSTPEGRKRLLLFLAHEYFHHYNVKRVRPAELGPFDYDNGNRTKMLWVSEGLSVYYEYLVLLRKGLITSTDLLNAIRGNLKAYENKPGRLYQSVAEASYETWSDGPFGRTGDEVNKTISVYDKGPVMGLLLDLTIRHETGNKRSLDDLMRLLYYEFYKKRQRGFSEAELRAACEKIAGKPLDEFFNYIYTVQTPDYPKYFAYAGLAIDTLPAALPGGWLGISTRYRDDTLSVTAVDWNSPAWYAGIRMPDKILLASGTQATKKQFDEMAAARMPGDKIKLLVLHNGKQEEKEITLSTRFEKSFTIKPINDPGKLQKAILHDWLKE